MRMCFMYPLPQSFVGSWLKSATQLNNILALTARSEEQSVPRHRRCGAVSAVADRNLAAAGLA